MTEHNYKINQRTGKAPIIHKIGAMQIGCESTPIVWKNKFMSVESRLPDKVCDRQHIRVRDIETGKVTAPFGLDYYFASAFVENEVLYVFATNRHDDKDLTMYASDDEKTWHDPRGGHAIRMFRTADLENWEERDILTCPTKRLWNTSVCHGKDGYMMAVEVSAETGYEIPEIGVPFTCFFASSIDLTNWEMLPDDYSYTYKRYNACPALRYVNGKYYMICLEELPCARYAPYIYRTENFLDWEVGLHNPIMMWSDEDRQLQPGYNITKKEQELLESGLNINCSDIDLCEYKGQTHIFYANGDQMTYSFLCEAVYDGPLNEFLEAFFR